MIRASIVIFCSIFLFSCNQNNVIDIKDSDIDKAFSEVKTRIVLEKDGIKLIEANDFPLFKDTELSLVSDTNIFQFGPNKIELKLDNYYLGGSTTDQDEKNVRLNSTGQFLFVIKDQKVIEKSKDLNFKFDLKRGNNSFFVVPSRSYEMSIKNKNSWLAYELNIDNIKNRALYHSITEPGIFICSPSSRYYEGVSERVLFDFFVINTELSLEGSKVILEIDKSTKFTLDTWRPFYVEGLKSGKHNFKAYIVDKDDKPLKGKYSSFGPIYFSTQTVNY